MGISSFTLTVIGIIVILNKLGFNFFFTKPHNIIGIILAPFAILLTLSGVFNLVLRKKINMDW